MFGVDRMPKKDAESAPAWPPLDEAKPVDSMPPDVPPKGWERKP